VVENVNKERRQSRDMETLTEQEYLMGGQLSVSASSDNKGDKSSAADAGMDDPFFGRQ